MAYRDYVAPGVSVIVERQETQPVVNFDQFYPVFIGTGLTSNSRTLTFSALTADTTDFPTVTLTVNLKNLINSQLYNLTDFSIASLSVNQIDGDGDVTTVTLNSPADYTATSVASNVSEDGVATIVLEIIKNTISSTDVVYNVSLTAQNAGDDFDLRLVQSSDSFIAREIFGPFMLTENGNSIRNDVAFAAEIAFRTGVPAFYYLEVPRTYGSAATAANMISVLEKVFFKANAYRLVPLTSDPDVSTAVRDLVSSISNPYDKRETVGFLTYPESDIEDISDIAELKTKVGGFSQTLDHPRVCNVFGGRSVELVVSATTYTLPPCFLATAVASLDSSIGLSSPLSLRDITIFRKLNGPKFRPQQWNSLAEKKVFILFQNDATDPITIRHQLTTSQSGAAEDEEYSLVKNIDVVTRLLRDRLSPYAGKFNITDGLIEKLNASLTLAISEAKDLGLAREITIMSPWSIRRIPSQNGTLEERRNLVTRLQMIPAYPANNLDVYLMI